MNRINNLTGIFHATIIAMFLLSLSGCGYKEAPYYIKDAPKGDENVNFIIKKPNEDMSDSNSTRADR